MHEHHATKIMKMSLSSLELLYLSPKQYPLCDMVSEVKMKKEGGVFIYNGLIGCQVAAEVRLINYCINANAQ